MIIELSSKKKNSKKRADLLRLQTIFTMHKYGKNNRKIAKACNCSASTVSNALNKYKRPNKLVWKNDVSVQESKVCVGYSEGKY